MKVSCLLKSGGLETTSSPKRLCSRWRLGDGYGLFPLTPALSLGERETDRQSGGGDNEWFSAVLFAVGAVGGGYGLFPLTPALSLGTDNAP